MRDWLAGIVGENMATGALLIIVTVAIVLAFVILLMVFRGFSGTVVRSNKRTRQARLAVIDAAVVDSKRRLVLVRRDDVEHLVMIGGPSDVVIEAGITRQHALPTSKTAPPRTHSQATVEPAPLREENVRTPRPAPQPTMRTTSPPGRPQPVPSPQIRPVSKPPVSTDSAIAEPVSKAQTQTPSAPVVPSPPAAVGAASSPVSPARVAPANITAGAVAPNSPAASPASPPSSSAKPVKTADATQFSSPVSPVASAAVTPPNAAPSPEASIAPAVIAEKPAVTRPPESIIRAQPSQVLQSASAKPTPSQPSAKAEDNNELEEAISENKLADFEDNLAMNLGESLVPEAADEQESSLASEMDALLSEITSGTKPKT